MDSTTTSNNKTRRNMTSTSSSSTEDVQPFKDAFAELGKKVADLNEKAADRIDDVTDQEALTHECVKKKYKQKCDAEFYRLATAPIKVVNAPKIDLGIFIDKDREIQQERYQLQRRQEEVKQELRELEMKYEEVQESMRKKLDIIEAYKKKNQQQ